MTRRKTEDLKGETRSRMPDNTEQLIHPVDARQALIDIVDSLRSSYGYLHGAHSTAPVGFNLTEEWQPITAPNLFDAMAVADPDEIAADQVTGSFKTKKSGFDHFFTARLSVAGSANDEIQFCLMEDGVPGEIVIMGMTLLSPSKLQAVDMANLLRVPDGQIDYQIGVRAKPGVGSAQLNVYLVTFLCELVPTR